MRDPVRSTRRTAALLAAVLAGGCASGKPAAPSAPPPPRAAPPQAPVEPLPPVTAPAEPEPAKPQKDPTLIVIDPAADPVPAPSLAAAAAAEKRRRAEVAAQSPTVVITDKNLSEYAAGGVLTIAHGDAPADDATASELEADAQRRAAREAYWRQRGLDIRRRWHDAVESVSSLEAKAEELRTRFYATDDPVVRDSQVKPEWDRALAELEQARFQAAHGREEVEQYLEEGRRAGALPGWLREGVDLEPEPVLPTADGSPSEPPAYPDQFQDPALYPEQVQEPPVADEPPPPRRRG